MRSALTEQLAGAPQQAVKPDTTSAPIVLLSDPAFPCLRHAKGEVVEAVESAGFEEPDVAKMSLPGTAPSSSLTPGQRRERHSRRPMQHLHNQLAHEARALDQGGGSCERDPELRAKMGQIIEKVDYQLNPHKRRGGEEIVGASFTGLSTLNTKASMGRSMQGSLLGGQAIGSLPAGLSLQAKKDILQATPMSPALSLLGSLGVSGPVGSATLEGKNLRRSVLRGAVIIFVTAGYSGKRFIFERCRQLGLRSVVIDGPDSWSSSLVKDGLIEKFVSVDFTDTDTLFDRVLAACVKVRTDMGELDGVTTFCELAVPLVARLAERLGLPSNTPEAVDTARNKHAARAAMSNAGLPTPKNFLIETSEHLQPAAEHVGFPAVIKPISGAASIGVVRVDNEAGLREKYAEVMKNLKSARVVAGALVEGDDDGDDAAGGGAAGWMDLSIMMEEYLDGTEVDVDLVFSNGTPVYGAITDNWPTMEPWFNETGSNCPSILPRSQQMELLDLGVKAVQCMGFQLGVFHVELKYTSRGARLIEVNARMGGGPVRDTNLLVWGVDLVEQHVTAACGIPVRPPVAPKPLTELAELTINANTTGVLEADDFMEPAAKKEGMLYARPLVKAGAKCVCSDDGLPTWIGEMMLSHAPVEEAIKLIKQAEAELSIRITPKQA